MAGYPTDLYVASQTAHELVVVAPPFNSHSFGWIWIVSLLCLVIGYGVIFSLWKNVPRPIHPALRLTWLIPIVIAGPFLVLGVIGQIKTQITLSADTGALSVRKTLLSFLISSKEYPFSELRSIKVGVADISLFLYVSLVDKPAENLTGATDQTGYSEVADAMNAFLVANRR
ncbi:hypothetical protein [Edaphobacter modestus]|uniref:PH (Pleckstrin Homology) domain-containing protein n=1 Tax=Edaphobacter modestus TaxID=388466 RepID=A0A4Q7YTE1_9BACT|nr:hypothetical protein [Edaphobacter modestus]RZU40321.1 hypothetical protein BDD14_1767 [Edaphobacter modestus]